MWVRMMSAVLQSFTANIAEKFFIHMLFANSIYNDPMERMQQARLRSGIRLKSFLHWG